MIGTRQVDERLICMLIGMVATFMAGLYFERFMARRFLHGLNIALLGGSASGVTNEEKSSFVAVTAFLLSKYYNCNMMVDMARKAAKDRMTKKDKSHTKK